MLQPFFQGAFFDVPCLFSGVIQYKSRNSKVFSGSQLDIMYSIIIIIIFTPSVFQDPGSGVNLPMAQVTANQVFFCF